MNLNDVVAAKNLELVYRAADKYFEQNGEIPRQVDILAKCPGMSKQTVKKYRKEWLAERGLSSSEDSDDDISIGLRKAINIEIRDRKAKAHKEIHDQLQDLDDANDSLSIENEFLRGKVSDSTAELLAVKEQNAHFAGQLHTFAEQIQKLEAALQESAAQVISIHDQCEKKIAAYQQAKREALERERVAREELGALASSKDLAKSEILWAEVLEKALKREEWFAEKFVKQSAKSLPNRV
jgi:hypothetical protein